MFVYIFRNVNEVSKKICDNIWKANLEMFKEFDKILGEVYKLFKIKTSLRIVLRLWQKNAFTEKAHPKWNFPGNLRLKSANSYTNGQSDIDLYQ